MDFRGSILRIEASVDQKFDVKMEPQSDTIEWRRPRSLTMSETNNCANSGVVVDVEQGMKWVILVIRSTNMRIESLPFETGRSMIKLQDKPFQRQENHFAPIQFSLGGIIAYLTFAP